MTRTLWASATLSGNRHYSREGIVRLDWTLTDEGEAAGWRTAPGFHWLAVPPGTPPGFYSVAVAASVGGQEVDAANFLFPLDTGDSDSLAVPSAAALTVDVEYVFNPFVSRAVGISTAGDLVDGLTFEVYGDDRGSSTGETPSPQPTTTLQKVAAAIRVTADGQDPPEPVRTTLSNQIAVALALTDRYANKAPEEVKLESAIRVCGYLFDAPTAPEGRRWSSAFRNSGAAGLLSPWRVRRLGIVGLPDDDSLPYVALSSHETTGRPFKVSRSGLWGFRVSGLPDGARLKLQSWASADDGWIDFDPAGSHVATWFTDGHGAVPVSTDWICRATTTTAGATLTVAPLGEDEGKAYLFTGDLP